MASNLENRIVKLELVSGPKRSYVVRVSNPKTKAELAELAAAAAEGRKVILAPHPVASLAEWVAKYGHASAGGTR
jgi:hypothetical protein